MKTFFAILLLITFMSCDQSPTSGSTGPEDQKPDLSTADTYVSTITIQPTETVELNSTAVGFYAWKYVSLKADLSVQVSVNNIILTPELTSLTVDGVYWEGISISNTLNDKPVNVEIQIRKYKDGQ